MKKTIVSEKIKSLDSNSLKKLLKELNLYRSLNNSLGKRGIEEFHRYNKGEKKLLVEYFPLISEELVWEKSKYIYSKVFGIEANRDKVKFIKKDSLKGGIKIYLDDNLIDLSYSKVEKSII